ncbi:NADH dehydrogenase [ubiquinone] 1 subunit C1, mitochondrial [Psammomys obesus]|uniref:NADH dehydrogenase [ubiquinone] 1 subunit C1, mitochondrial n=1 Tax=Psammomys obesus TaxID=48139 RepID=UPI002452A60A|nr:NADH dehydrogenase [ubiquinone] 1 subunit C1, mitochondrial [Psammomys obesus]
MAPSVVLRRFSRLLASTRLPISSSTRSKFYVREPMHAKPNWFKVGLSVGTTIFLWGYLINQHNEDVMEYKRRNGLE